MANEPKKPAEESGGVKSYEAPERTTPPTGRIITFVVLAIVAVALLIWLL